MSDIDLLTSKLKDIRINEEPKQNKERYIIKKSIDVYLNKLNKLEKIKYKKITLEYKSIFLFHIISSRTKNDTSNRIREIIICCIINNTIPNDFFRYSRLWKNLKNNIFTYINNIFSNIDIKKISCKLSAGRSNNYDFTITIHNNNNEEINKNIEFKFNTCSVDDCPQFISLSDKFELSHKKYADFFYDNYLKEITDLYNIDIIDKDIYLKYIYQSNFNKNIFFKKLYENETNNENKLINSKKLIVDKSINDYIVTYINDFYINKLTKKFLDSQKDKIYMLYNIKTHTFKIDQINDNELKLLNKYNLKKNKLGFVNKIIYETESKKATIHILLRWRNHLGILNPAFQISIKR